MYTVATIKTRKGDSKRVSYGDPLWCTLDNCRVRFLQMVDGMIAVMTDEGKPLPDYRHPTQVLAY